MSKISMWLATIMILVGLSARVHAQHEHHHHSFFAPPPIQSDLQFFAPAEFDKFAGDPAYRTGWFAGYDRVYMNISRQEGNQTIGNIVSQGDDLTQGDFTWGNRYAIGYVGEDRKGWSVVGWHLDGPQAVLVVNTERINRTNPAGSPDNPAVNPFRDNNNRLTADRDYLVTNSLNLASMSSVELNRTWLLKPLHDGSLLEPFVGFRYTRFRDHHLRQNYERFDDTGALIPPGAPRPIQQTATHERLTGVSSQFFNDMVGGQAGIRWYREYRRLNLHGDVKFFALQNFQNLVQTTNIENTFYSGFGGNPIAIVNETRQTDPHAQEFVFGIDVRAEAAYEVTRDVSAKLGFEFMHFGQGIGRGATVAQNEQDLIMYGVTFGLELNR